MVCMAERAHEIPAKYGDVLELFHPRMRSYGRQIAAELGVSEQAISKRRLASFFEEEAEALPLAIALIEALDPVPTGAAS